MDLGKTSSTIHTNFEKEELESKSDFSVYIYTQSITWARILLMLTVYTEQYQGGPCVMTLYGHRTEGILQMHALTHTHTHSHTRVFTHAL